jgi:hypothetical protein
MFDAINCRNISLIPIPYAVSLRYTHGYLKFAPFGDPTIYSEHRTPKVLNITNLGWRETKLTV